MAPTLGGMDRRDLLLLGLAAACWGLGTVVSKRAIDELSPILLFAIQLTASLAALGLLMRRARLPLTGAPALLGRLGLLNPGLAYALGLIGLSSISASLYVLLWAFEPLLILALAHVFLGEGITRRFALLSMTAAVGMALIVYEPSAGGQLPGVLLVLAGVVCCAGYTVLARRWVGTADSTAQVVLAQQAYAWVLAVALAGVEAVVVGFHWTGVSSGALVGAAGSGLLYYAAAYWFYLSALRRVPASLAATSFYLVPVFGLAASFLWLGERLTASEWLGVGIVAAAILSIVRLESAGERNPLLPRQARSDTGAL